MSLACLDNPAPGTLKREIDKEDIFLTGIACYSLSQLQLLSNSRAHVKAAHSAVLLANILPIDSNICFCTLQRATLRVCYI